MKLSEAIGRLIGGALAPLAALGSLARRARLFHPDGVLYRADVEPIADDTVARALAGSALVRLSGALWRWPRGAKLPDILGIAVRFHPENSRAQDLLFATFRTSLELPLALFTTNVRDFLANTYGTVLPSRAPELGLVDFRLVPEPIAGDGADRRDRLERAVRAGRAVFVLQVRERRARARYRGIALLRLREQLEGGGEELRFDPFHAGAGIEPAGFLQAIRALTYPASQMARSLAHRARAPREA
jgi:hypothetical protein